MNYEEKYNEALERAKSFQEKYGGDYAGYIFPELAESEDEKIRKWLVNYFKEVGKSWIHRDINPEQIIAYLEKQKEHKPAEWSEDEFHKTTNLVYKAIRKALASLAVYAEDGALLDSQEETLCYYSQHCAEEIFKSMNNSKSYRI